MFAAHFKNTALSFTDCGEHKYECNLSSSSYKHHILEGASAQFPSNITYQVSQYFMDKESEVRNARSFIKFYYL